MSELSKGSDQPAHQHSVISLYWASYGQPTICFLQVDRTVFYQSVQMCRMILVYSVCIIMSEGILFTLWVIWTCLVEMILMSSNNIWAGPCKTCFHVICRQRWPCAQFLSGSSLSASRIIGYYRTNEWRVKAKMIHWACAGWSESASFMKVWRYIFAWLGLFLWR